jgi:hypothetical protein
VAATGVDTSSLAVVLQDASGNPVQTYTADEFLAAVAASGLNDSTTADATEEDSTSAAFPKSSSAATFFAMNAVLLAALGFAAATLF